LFPFFLNPFAAVHPADWHGQEWRVQTVQNGTTTQVVVTNGTNASSTTLTLNAPYGVKSEIVSENGKTYATTTPITEADVKQMEAEQAQFEAQMNKIWEDQQKLFEDMWSGVPF
jgi:hypothetical protein